MTKHLRNSTENGTKNVLFSKRNRKKNISKKLQRVVRKRRWTRKIFQRLLGYLYLAKYTTSKY